MIKLGVELDFSTVYRQIEEARQLIAKGEKDLEPVKDNVLAGNEAGNERKHILETIREVLTGDTSGLSKEDQKKAELMNIASEGFKRGAEGLTSILRTSFEIVSNIYKEMKQASPLLQAVEQIFQLAWTLFFMPLGNKLGELLIPAVLELLDGVVAIWDTIGEGNLGDIFMGVIQQGVVLMGEFFKDMGEQLSEQGGLLGQIGKLLQAIGNFIENGLMTAITTVLTVITAIVSHIGTIITLITTFMGIHYALQLAMMATIATSGSIAGWFGAGLVPAAVGGVAGAALGIGISNALGLPMAEGGIIPATPGGVHILAGEAGEDEYIIPKSKLPSFIDYMNEVMSNVPEPVQETETYLPEPMEANIIEDVNEAMGMGPLLDSMYEAISSLHVDSEAVMDVPKETFDTEILDTVKLNSETSSVEYAPQIQSGVPEVSPIKDVSTPKASEYLNEIQKSTNNTSNVYNVNVNGYTDSELKQIIEDIISEQVSRSNIRGGF